MIDLMSVYIYTVHRSQVVCHQMQVVVTELMVIANVQSGGPPGGPEPPPTPTFVQLSCNDEYVCLTCEGVGLVGHRAPVRELRRSQQEVVMAIFQATEQ